MTNLKLYNDTQLLHFVLDILSKSDKYLTKQDEQDLHEINVEFARRFNQQAGWRY